MIHEKRGVPLHKKWRSDNRHLFLPPHRHAPNQERKFHLAGAGPWDDGEWEATTAYIVRAVNAYEKTLRLLARANRTIVAVQLDRHGEGSCNCAGCIDAKSIRAEVEKAEGNSR